MLVVIHGIDLLGKAIALELVVTTGHQLKVLQSRTPTPGLGNDVVHLHRMRVIPLTTGEVPHPPRDAIPLPDQSAFLGIDRTSCPGNPTHAASPTGMTRSNRLRLEVSCHRMTACFREENRLRVHLVCCTALPCRIE